MNYLEKARQLLSEEMLMEDRIDFLKEKNPVIDTSHDINAKSWDVTSSGVIDHLASKADPTKNKSHTQWLVKQYKNKSIRLEDSPRIHTALSSFEKYKGKLEKKDINSYKSVGEVEDAVAPHIGTHSSKRSEDKEIKSEGAELVHKDPESGMTIYHIKTEEAAKLYGKGTKWCTAADKDNQFDNYNESGKLFVIQHKGEKYQYHRESEQFMNAKDEAVSHKEFNKIREPLHKAWKDHPEISLKKNSDFDWKYGEKSSKEINDVIKGDDPDISLLALERSDITPEHISTALNSSDNFIRIAGIEHPTATSEHITKALDDPDYHVRHIAKTKLSNINLNEDTTLRYHKELNPKIWNSEGNLQPNVEAHLINIANDWVEFAKIPKDAIKDIVLTGGNCNYNYTSQSDLDVHIMLEYSKVSDNKEILRDYYFSKKAIWATRHKNVNVSGYPVELFAQDISEKPHKGQGIYSLTKNEWIQKPDFLDLDLEHDLGVEFSAKEYATRINSTIKHDRGIETAQPLLDEIYNMRGAGITEGGEFSKGTLLFKELRNLGLIDKLNKYILKQQDLGYSYAE